MVARESSSDGDVPTGFVSQQVSLILQRRYLLREAGKFYFEDTKILSDGEIYQATARTVLTLPLPEMLILSRDHRERLSTINAASMPE